MLRAGRHTPGEPGGEVLKQTDRGSTDLLRPPTIGGTSFRALSIDLVPNSLDQQVAHLVACTWHESL
jgi:hypothetical protein